MSRDTDDVETQGPRKRDGTEPAADSRIWRLGPSGWLKGLDAMRNARKCEATRRDGAPCQRPAERGRKYCRSHRNPGAYNSRREPVAAAQRAERKRARARMIALAQSAPPELTAREAWARFEEVGDRRRQAALVLSWQALVSGVSGVSEFLEAEQALIDSFEAAQARQAKHMARRYAEREALGIPHPEDKKRW